MLLVDVEALLRDGVIGPAQAEEMRRRARVRLVRLVIEALLVAGVGAVVGGTCILLDDAGAIALFGAVVTAAALAALGRFGPWAVVVGNAAAAVGVAMLAIGGAWRLDEALGAGAVAGFGLALGLAGAGLLRRGGARLGLAAAGMVLAGALVHLAGLARLEPDAGVAWLLMLYAGALLVAVGVAVDLRPVTFLAGLPLMAVAGARGLYGRGSHGPLADEPGLTILFLGAVGLAAALWARREGRAGRHGGALALACFLGINLSFWVGSIRGDVVGLHLWGPRYEHLVEMAEGAAVWEAWRAAQAAFEAQALVLPAWGFAVVWAVLIVAVGVRAALGLRRETVNMAATFGAFHVFTQYFLHVDATPGAVALAGLMAIGAAAGLWRLNRALQPG